MREVGNFRDDAKLEDDFVQMALSTYELYTNGEVSARRYSTAMTVERSNVALTQNSFDSHITNFSLTEFHQKSHRTFKFSEKNVITHLDLYSANYDVTSFKLPG